MAFSFWKKYVFFCLLALLPNLVVRAQKQNTNETPTIKSNTPYLPKVDVNTLISKLKGAHQKKSELEIEMIAQKLIEHPNLQEKEIEIVLQIVNAYHLPVTIADLMVRKARYSFNHNRFNTALDQLQQALPTYKKYKREKVIQVYNLMALNYSEAIMVNLADKYYAMAIELGREFPSSQYLPKVELDYASFIITNYQEGDDSKILDKASGLSREVVETAYKRQDYTMWIYGITNQLMIANLTDDINLGKKSIEKAETILASVHHKEGICDFYMHAATFLANTTVNELILSNQYLAKAMKIADEQKLIDYQILGWQLKANIAYRSHDIEDVYLSNKKVEFLTKTVYDTKLRTEMAFLETNLNVKELELEKQETSNQLKAQKELVLSLTIIGIGLVVFLGFLIFAYRAKRKYSEQLLILNASIEKKNETLLSQAEKLKRLNTALDHSNADLNDSLAALKVSNNRLSSFAHIVSHDLRAPLRAISNFAGLIDRRYKKDIPEEAVEFVGFIKQGAKKMDSLIHDILEMSNVNTMDVKEEIDLNEVLSEVKNTLQLDIDREKAVVIGNNLPKIVGAKVEYYQLFQNFISNSIKYKQTDKSPNIEVVAERNNGVLTITFKDNGRGISELAVDSVFNKFNRAGETSQDGYGIGLATCKEIVERNGGQIRVESQVGVGSTFFIDLKLQ